MANNNGFGKFSKKLSNYLNKAVNDTLAATVQARARAESLEEFSKFVKALGVKNDSQAEEIYQLVNRKIDIEENGGLSDARLSKATLSKPARSSGVKLQYDDLSDEDDIVNDSFARKPIGNQPLIDLNEKKSIIEENETTRPKFKKIKRETAFKLKQVQPQQVLEPRENLGKNAEEEKAKNGQNSIQTTTLKGNRILDETSHHVELINTSAGNMRKGLKYNVDKPSYTNDFERGNSTKERLEQLPSFANGPGSRNRTGAESGGFFNSQGQYVDNDHLPANDLNRITISNHVLIPPFLKNVEEHLTLQITGTSVRGAGPTINPVKDINSELASMAKQGSLAVQNQRSKQERAKQAKESTGTGSNSTTSHKELRDMEANPETVRDGKNAKTREGDREKEDDDDDDDDDEKVDYESIMEQRRSLPAFAVKDDVVATIRDNQVTIIIGETGSGKTTQLTQYLYEAGLAHNADEAGQGSGLGVAGQEKKMIACTQPRRVAAMSVAKRVSEEMGVKLGAEVGYSVRFDDKTSNSTLIKYMTEGILLREILADPLLLDYSCIIMDEAHERSLNTDILLGLFKGLLARRRDLKLIVTSATMNADRFTRFFGAAPQFTIPGRTFPVDVYFNRNVSMDYVESAVKQILSIHLGSMAGKLEFVNDGDILVFMTGQEDIEITCDILCEKLAMLENPPPLDVLPIYSTMPPEMQKKIFRKKNLTRRKVVVATNIAETSLTVDGIKYVIDCGLVKVKVYNPKLGMDTLQVVPVSLANADQRSGRAGRTSAGVAYRLYTENATSSKCMYAQPIPEIQRTNLSNTMLLLKSLNVKDINNFPFLDPPPKDLLNCSLYDLWAIDALDNYGELTKLGLEMVQFPIEPTLSKLILLSTQPEFHCSEDIVTIVAMLSVSNIFFRSKERAKESDLAREKFVVADSDHLTLLNVYTQWEVNVKKFGNNWTKLTQWCEKNFLQLKSLHRAKEIRRQLVQIMHKNKLPLLKSYHDDDVRKCLCATFYHQAAKLIKTNVNGSPEFINLRHSYMKMYLHPTSSLLDSNMGLNYVVYHELVLTSKEYMNYVTCVEPTWLLEYGYKFYGVPENVRTKLKGEECLVPGDKFKEQIEEDLALYEEQEAQKRDMSKTIKKQNNKSGSLLFKRRRF